MKKYPKAIIGIQVSCMLPGELGVFALRNLKKGQIINKCGFGDETLYNLNIYKKLDKITRQRVDGFCATVYDGFFSIPNINYMPISWHCNHCCSPNVGFDKKNNMVLIKNVSAGKELFLDYGFVITNPDFLMKCKCGSKNCRKVITGNDWLNKEFSKKNKQYMCV